MRKRNWILTVILLMSGLFTACNSGMTTALSTVDGAAESIGERTFTDSSDPGVMLHAYMWSFNDIEGALPEISAAGYTSIQTSPVQRTKADGQWWLLYQPCNFDIGNTQLGSYNDFVSLCSAAEGYGIKIIVDAVLNHVADNGTDGGWSDSIDSYLKRSDWYHNQGTCTDYSSRWNVTQQNLGNLPDLNTQNYDVQNVIKGFLNKCVSAGADGFRFDAAKHIETNSGEDQNTSWSGNFWDNVLGGLNNKDNLYLVGEVLPDNSDNDETYTNYFDITAHGYIWTVDNAVQNKNLTGLGTLWQKDHELSPTRAMVYAENHDTYEHSETTSLSYYTRKMASAILIARADVVPRIFDRPNEELWKDQDIAAINHFHNAMTGTTEYLRNPESDILVIERGNSGVAIINVGEGTDINCNTNLSAGTYVNKASASATLTSNGSQLSGYVPGGSIIALYNGVIPVDHYTSMNLRGTLNSWTAEGMTLNSNEIWTKDVSLNEGTSILFKFDAYGDWSTNWGDNNADGYCEISGNNISYTPSVTGTYTLSFNDQTMAYSIELKDGSDPTIPAIPEGLTATPSLNSIEVSWISSPTAESYTIMYSTSQDGTYISTQVSGQTSTSLTGLTENTTYYIKITASNSEGTSGESEKITATTTSGSTVETTFRIHYDVGMGNFISLRGDTSPLSWTSGIEADWSAGNVWVLTLTDIPSGTSIAFKPLINDSQWASGGDYTVTAGSSVDIYPNF